MRVNNFKQMGEEDEGDYYPNLSSQVQANVESTLGIFRFFGQVVEVFLPKVVDTIIVMSGGDAPDQDTSSKERRGSSYPPPRRKGPSRPPANGR